MTDTTPHAKKVAMARAAIDPLAALFYTHGGHRVPACRLAVALAVDADDLRMSDEQRNWSLLELYHLVYQSAEPFRAEPPVRGGFIEQPSPSPPPRSSDGHDCHL